MMTTEKSNTVDRVLVTMLKRVRPRMAESGVTTRVALGWSIRMGLDPLVRGSIRRLYSKNLAFPSFVGRRVRLLYSRQFTAGPGLFLGRGTIVNAFSVNGVRLGREVTIRENGWIQCSSSPAQPGIGITIGNRVYIGPGVIIGVGGEIAIGDDVQIGSGVVLISENHVSSGIHDLGGSKTEQVEVSRIGITIGDRCWLGHKSMVMDGVTLGHDCRVGAGAVVTKSFGPGSTLVGVPARSVVQTVEDSGPDDLEIV